ncbi:hypothetical protein CEXT_508521 [Caerostris extrusa]|uniref:Uncharacterized protein n=1 Tax=Caerostris extrusa TaxID=172846 RepID=A0AAV4UZT7_CAEEX|nr:hypothetical protein CEXT_508521 [Caerostris extrusa]
MFMWDFSKVPQSPIEVLLRTLPFSCCRFEFLRDVFRAQQEARAPGPPLPQPGPQEGQREVVPATQMCQTTAPAPAQRQVPGGSFRHRTLQQVDDAFLRTGRKKPFRTLAFSHISALVNPLRRLVDGLLSNGVALIYRRKLIFGKSHSRGNASISPTAPLSGISLAISLWRPCINRKESKLPVHRAILGDIIQKPHRLVIAARTTCGCINFRSSLSG